MNTQPKIDRSAVFRDAWARARRASLEAGDNVRLHIGAALRAAWARAKGAAVFDYKGPILAPAPVMIPTPFQQQQALHATADKEVEGFNLMKFWLDEYGVPRHDTWPVLFAKASDAEPLKAALLAGTGDPTFWGPDDVECGASLDIEPVYRSTNAMVPTPCQQQQARDLRLASTVCDACGRELTDPVSIEAGIGPICRAAGHARRQLGLFDNPSDYRIELVGDVICITDLNRGGRSVTNDAEGVIEDLRRLGYDLSRMPVIYKGSTGRWDELVVTDSRFAGFRAINGDRQQALRALR